MMKLFCKCIVTSLTVLVFVFGMSTNVFALPIEPIATYSGNYHQLSVDEINALIDSYSPQLPNIAEDSWPPNQVEMGEDTDIKSYTFDDLNTNYFITKEGPISYVYFVGGISTFDWVSNDGKGLSNYASVPDASIMLLLGSSLMGLAVFSRKSKRT